MYDSDPEPVADACSFPAVEYSTVPQPGADDFTVPQFLPTASVSGIETGPQDAFGNPGSIPYEAQPDDSQYNPWRSKQIHYVGSRAIEGEHPDPTVQEAVRIACERMIADAHQVFQLLETVQTHNDDYAAELERTKEVVTDYFGDKAAAAPYHILSPHDYQQIAGIHGYSDGEIRGITSLGHIFVRDDPKKNAVFGKRPTVYSMLHESGHRRAQGHSLLVAQHTKHRTGLRIMQKETKYYVRHVPQDLTEQVVDPKHGILTQAEYIEEGVVESFATRTADYVLGESTVVQGLLEVTFPRTIDSTGKNPIVFTDGTQSLPHYDKATDCLYLPWRYAQNVAPGENGQGIQVNPQVTTIAAYGIDLLDQQLPNLYEEMLDAHTNDDLKQHVKKRVNSVELGLHDRLAMLPYTYPGLHTGTRPCRSACASSTAR